VNYGDLARLIKRDAATEVHMNRFRGPNGTNTFSFDERKRCSPRSPLNTIDGDGPEGLSKRAARGHGKTPWHKSLDRSTRGVLGSDSAPPISNWDTCRPFSTSATTSLLRWTMTCGGWQRQVQLELPNQIGAKLTRIGCHRIPAA